jgi:hypothetical protein
MITQRISPSKAPVPRLHMEFFKLTSIRPLKYRPCKLFVGRDLTLMPQKHNGQTN